MTAGTSRVRSDILSVGAWGCVFLAVLVLFASLGRRVFSSGPKAVCAKEMTLGKLETEADVIGCFEVENKGTETLSLKPLSTCACLPVSVSTDTLPPDGRATVVFRLKSPAKFGDFEKSVMLASNDPKFQDQPLHVRIKGTVNEGIAIAPGSLDLGRIPWGEERERRITLLSAEESAAFTLASSSISSSICPELVAMGDNAATLSVTVRHPRRRGILNERLSILTTNRSRPFVSVPVTATLSGAITASPGRLLFEGTLGRNDRIEKKSVIYLSEPGMVSVAETDGGNDGQFTASIEPGPNSQEKVLHVTLDFGRLSGNLDKVVSVRYADRLGFEDVLPVRVCAYQMNVLRPDKGVDTSDEGYDYTKRASERLGFDPFTGIGTELTSERTGGSY